jgi:hypothetical protein
MHFDLRTSNWERTFLLSRRSPCEFPKREFEECRILCGQERCRFPFLFALDHVFCPLFQFLRPQGPRWCSVSFQWVFTFFVSVVLGLSPRALPAWTRTIQSTARLLLAGLLLWPLTPSKFALQWIWLLVLLILARHHWLTHSELMYPRCRFLCRLELMLYCTS